MYREFFAREQNRRFQKILWRNTSGDIQPYHLNTVTFGLSATPYLVTRCIHQLADDEAEQYPIAANILKQDLYVDDLITGTQTRDQALQLRDQVIGLLKQGGINIRQWASNDRTLLEGLPEAAIRLPLQPDEDTTIKTLGIYWNSQTDTINYSVSPVGNHITKRSILSDIAKIFHPLGLLGPVVVKAKIFLQQPWLLKLYWDELVPSTIYTAWREYCTQLTHLNNIAFPGKRHWTRQTTFTCTASVTPARRHSGRESTCGRPREAKRNVLRCVVPQGLHRSSQSSLRYTGQNKHRGVATYPIRVQPSGFIIQRSVPWGLYAPYIVAFRAFLIDHG